jgi:hypothetical protein
VWSHNWRGDPLEGLLLRQKYRKVITVAFGLCLLLALVNVYVGTSTAWRRHRTFIVSASGDTSGVTDTVNIQTAFDNAVEHRGSTVRLSYGKFYLNKEIVVVNFDGTFKGAGEGKTIIQNTAAHPFPLVSDPIWGPDGPEGVGFAQMFLFYQNGDTESTAWHPYTIKITDMTIRVVRESETWILPGMEWFTATSINPFFISGIARMECVEDEISYFNLFCHRLAIEGIASEDYFGFGSSAAHGIQFSGSNFLHVNQLSGIFFVKDCSFKAVTDCILPLGVFKDSLILIQGNSLETVLWGIEAYPGDSLLVISNNDICGVGAIPSFFPAYGIIVDQLDPESGKLLVYRNTIECADGAVGMLLADESYLAGGPITLSGYVVCNTIILGGPNSVDMFNLCSEDVKFYHNTILGP